ncbi:MAG: hypothetical protein QOI86_5501, partial [Actinomycetota bacterium]|nr:hypothetical protein [Actinomycetota bacterium]
MAQSTMPASPSGSGGGQPPVSGAPTTPAQ